MSLTGFSDVVDQSFTQSSPYKLSLSYLRAHFDKKDLSNKILKATLHTMKEKHYIGDFIESEVNGDYHYTIYESTKQNAIRRKLTQDVNDRIEDFEFLEWLSAQGDEEED